MLLSLYAPAAPVHGFCYLRVNSSMRERKESAKQSATKDDAEEAVNDFRVRSARRKREKMRARLMEAMLRVCAERQGLPTVIDEVTQEAKVSRGTFYNYFDSLEQLTEAIGTKLSDDLSEEALRLMPEISQGLLGTAAGIRLLLSRAAVDPVWGSFVVHSDFLNPDTTVGRLARQNLAEGHASAHFVFALYEVAIDVVLGSIREGVRRLLVGGIESDLYIYQLSIHILQALGVPHSAARSATEEVYTYFLRNAPGRLEWWPSSPARASKRT